MPLISLLGYLVIRKKTREEEIADFLSKYTRMELCESVRRVETMSHKEKIEHLAKYDD